MSQTAENWEPFRANPTGLSRKERRKVGRSRREQVGLDQHAFMPPPSDRSDAVQILTSQDRRRISELVPIRHGRMGASPFAFYRGAAAVMAADLASTSTPGIEVQLCGDAHLANFGLYNGPDRRLVFDLNDFDETHPGPFEWDVKRLAASVWIAGEANDLSKSKTEAAVRATVAEYRSMVGELASLGPLAVHYRRLEVDSLRRTIVTERGRQRMEKVTAKATSKNNLRAQRKLTSVVEGHRIIVPDPPFVTRVNEHATRENLEQVQAFYRRYLASLPLYRQRLLERYRVVDVARKIVGVGSVGTLCLIVLLESGDGEPLFLQLKEATPSVLETHLGAGSMDPGQRVVVGQRLMQAMGDVLLGWSHYEGEAGEPVYFYVRQLWDGKGSVDVADMTGKGLRQYATGCGAALALAHARAGDAAMIAGYLGKKDTFDQAVTEFAQRYAKLNTSDFERHRTAIASGALVAEAGV